MSDALSSGSEDLTAAEYALGVLNRSERAAAEARATREPAFAAEIRAWDQRLSPLVDAIPAVEPSAAVWPRVLRAIEGGGAANDAGARHTVAFWRNWAVGSTAAAVAALGFLALRPPTVREPTPVAVSAPAAQPMLVAQLVSDSSGAMTATYDPAKGALVAVPGSTLILPKGRAAELWLIPADGTPRSLGVVDPGKPTVVKVSDALKPDALPQAVLAITVERPGGSPNGKPTTKPLWVGKLAQL